MNNCPRVRDRLMLVCSGALAVAGFWAMLYVAQEYVLTPNSARFLMTMVAPQIAPETGKPATATTQPQESETDELFVEGVIRPPGMGARQARETIRQQHAARLQMQHQIGTVEVIVVIWEWVTGSALILVLLCAVLAAITSRCRLFALSSAVIILLSTVGTLIAMHLLVRPEYGGMPPLPLRTYLLVGTVQSTYGLILLLAFAGPTSCWSTAGE